MPHAVQVADRWHFLKNLGETLERLLGRFQHALRDTARELAGETAVAGAGRAAPAPSGKLPQLSQQRRARRLACYEEVVRLRQEGTTISAIARHMHLDRRTVRGWLRAGGFAERATRPPAPSKLDPYHARLAQRWHAGCRNGAELWNDIVARGYDGSKSILRRLLAAWRRHAPVTPARVHVAAPSPRCASAWVLGAAYRSKHKSEYQKQFVGRLCQAVPTLDTACRLANEFAAMLRKQRVPDLGGWVRQVGAAGIRELRQFADGLERDAQAVQATLTTDYSNGLAEGHINRLKMLKRQMYGRAGVELLRIRILHG